MISRNRMVKSIDQTLPCSMSHVSGWFFPPPNADAFLETATRHVKNVLQTSTTKKWTSFFFLIRSFALKNLYVNALGNRTFENLSISGEQWFINWNTYAERKTFSWQVILSADNLNVSVFLYGKLELFARKQSYLQRTLFKKKGFRENLRLLIDTNIFVNFQSS